MTIEQVAEAIREGERIKDAFISVKAFDAASSVRDLLMIARRYNERQIFDRDSHESQDQRKT